MSLFLEAKKLKRTGFFPAFFAGALLAASFPVVNTAARPEQFIHQALPPLQILLNANWRMLAMLNLFFLVIGACVLYHTEFAGQAMRKMESLPLRMGRMFAAKTVVLTLSMLFVLAVEAAAFAFCAWKWFPADGGFWPELLEAFGYGLVLCLPAAVLMMTVASLCRNLWVSLGVGVICIFIAMLLRQGDTFALALFPFAMPFETPAHAQGASRAAALLAAGVETLFFSIVQAAVFKVRRVFA